ncbi:MAG: hypothetical protein ACI89X_001026 [Planctomycetota bacterium]|jgi:hypothetical protein
MTADDVTFGLALIGYALLAAQFARVHPSREMRMHAIITACVVAAHVACVWGLRFEWSLTRMLDKSLSGFVIFHTALLLILVAPLVRGKLCVRVTTAAFALVTAGALPAPFRYPELSLLLWPLVAIAVTAIGYAIATNQRSPKRTMTE